MQKLFLSAGIVAAGTAVILGAFGAHVLKEKIAADQLPVFETAVRYQVYHAIALLILALMIDPARQVANVQLLTYSGYGFILGIIFFSGSLYLLSLRSLLGIESWNFLGPITPLGGLCFIISWVLMLVSVLKK